MQPRLRQIIDLCADMLYAPESERDRFKAILYATDPEGAG